MTRIEEIEKASKEYRESREECGVKDPILLDEVEEAFYVAGGWADKTMLEKAIKWLGDNIWLGMDENDEWDWTVFFESEEEMVESFKKAMEE